MSPKIKRRYFVFFLAVCVVIGPFQAACKLQLFVNNVLLAESQ